MLKWGKVSCKTEKKKRKSQVFTTNGKKKKNYKIIRQRNKDKDKQKQDAKLIDKTFNY